MIVTVVGERPEPGERKHPYGRAHTWLGYLGIVLLGVALVAVVAAVIIGLQVVSR